MIHIQTSKGLVDYTNRYAVAQYFLGGGKGYPPRNGLVENQYYVGQILEARQFHVLRPDRLCFLSEFLSFQLVSRQWQELSESERTLLVAVYNQKKLALESLSTELPAGILRNIASQLMRTGYLNLVDSGIVELTLIGEVEVQHQIFEPDVGESLLAAHGGIRVQHHSVQDHEIDLGRSSRLSINVDGMQIRISTLQDGGAVIEVDHDTSHRVFMSHKDTDRNAVQAYVEQILTDPGQTAIDLDTFDSDKQPGMSWTTPVKKVG